MLPADVTYDDHFGGGYFSSFMVWWWIPALTSVIAVALIPTVPYASRVGSQKGVSSLIHKVPYAPPIHLETLNCFASTNS